MPVKPNLLTLDAAFRATCAMRQDAVATIFEGRTLTFGDLAVLVDRIACALERDGVVANERVLILARNSDRYLAAVLACFRLGAVATPLSWRGTAAEIGLLAEDADARFAFVDSDLQSRLAEAAPDIQRVVLDGIELWQGWLSDCRAPRSERTSQLDDIALQIYTSGTTGRPKGAMLSNRSMNRTLHYRTDWRPDYLQITDDDRVVISLPMFHIGGIEFALRYLLHGASCVIERQYDTLEFLDLIARYSPTVIGVVPAMLNVILDEAGRRGVDFSSIRFVHYGAAPIPAELLMRAIAVVGAGFIQAYGLSETVGGVVFLAPYEHDPARPESLRSAGRPLPGAEMRIARDDGSDCGVDEIGEILLRGDFLMTGYWRQPAATAEAIDPDGWLRTGDMGSLDAAGLLFIRDRKKEMIVSGGENIYPAEVENALFQHPAVKDVAVIGIPDDRWGESVRAVVVVQPGAHLTLESLSAFGRARLAAFKVPTSLDIIDELPLAPSGKVLRRALRDPHWIGRSRQVN